MFSWEDVVCGGSGRLWLAGWFGVGGACRRKGVGLEGLKGARMGMHMGT